MFKHVYDLPSHAYISLFMYYIVLFILGLFSDALSILDYVSLITYYCIK